MENKKAGTIQIKGYETLEDELWDEYALDVEEVLDYLDRLRETGATKMFGAAPYLQDAFDFDRKMARDCLTYWMRTFGQRHSEDTFYHPDRDESGIIKHIKEQ
jgi:hypothetical protein